MNCQYYLFNRKMNFIGSFNIKMENLGCYVLNQAEESDIVCSKCNELNQVGSKKCWNCGKKLDKPKTKKKEATGKKRTFGDNMRQLKFNLTTVWANSKFVYRAIYREIKYFLPMKDLAILFSMIIILIIALILLIVYGFPMSISFINNTLNIEILDWFALQQSMFKFLTDPNVLRVAGTFIGLVTIIIRLMIKSPINKYRDKVNTRKDVTYIFGSSRAAEQLLFELIHQYGYEERVSLISDADLLWVKRLKGFIDTYVVEDLRELGKVNLYDLIGFKNASRVMILTESVELNQNILTHIRRIRPDIDIILLSQYAPAFVFSELVKDENLIIIEDLDMTIQGLVLSLSMDFDFPPTVEIDVPRTFIGVTGEDMTSDLLKQKVLLIRRGNELLSPKETLQIDDKVIIYYFTNYYMKLTNRVITEMPIKPKKKKGKKEKKSSKTSINNVEEPTQISEETKLSSGLVESKVD